LVPFFAVLGTLASCSTSGPFIKRTEDFEMTIRFQGLDRTFQVHLPAGYTGDTETPLLFVLHGSGSSGGAMRGQTEMDRVADALGFIVVYPDAEPAWAYPGSDAAQRGIDDVAFIEDLIDRLRNLLVVDARRIYATGFSMGGFLTHALACHLADRFAGVASVAATMPSALGDDCAPARHLSVLMVHGTLDASVPFGGDSARGRLSVDASMGLWARANGCAVAPSIAQLGADSAAGIALRRETYGGCDGGAATALDALEGGRHTWPQGFYQASDSIARFLLRGRR
jgi:polyhydroxybutyrate depolymerase